MSPHDSASNAPRLLAISGFQQVMVDTALDAQTSIHFHKILTVKLAFRITPGASARNLRHAFNKLVARHDSLRLRFVENGGIWKAEILPEHPTGLIIDDLSDLPQEAQMAQIIERATTPMTAFSNPLFEMHLIKCGRGGDVVLTRAHHSIVDGYGHTLLIEDLIKFVLNMPVLGAAVTHEQFITLQQQEIENRRAEADAFWYDHLIPPPKEPNVGRVAKGLPLLSPHDSGPSNNRDEILTPTQSKRLDALTKKTGISAFCYLYAAFSEAICDIADQDEIIVKSVLGRQDARLATFVGAEHQEFLLRFRRHPMGIHESAKQVQQNISEASRHLPTDQFYAMDSQITKEVSKTGTYGSRFFIHTLVPSGRLDASPFSKLFSKAMKGKISMGFVNLEQIQMPHGDNIPEIFLSIGRTSIGPNAELIALKSAFCPDELEDIARRMAAKLDI